MVQTRPAAPALAALVCAAIACWVSFGTMAFLDADPAAGYVGVLPSPLWLAVLLFAAVVIGVVARPTHRTVAPLWLSAVLVLPWLPLPMPLALFVWAGRISAWVWCGVAVSLVLAWARQQAWLSRVQRLTPGRTALLAGAVALTIDGASAWRTAPSHPSGDEPHYLVVTQSLLQDGDLQPENNYNQRDFALYYQGDIRPDYVRRGLNGAIYSSHAPGLSVLVLPVFALFGYSGTVVLLVVLSACTAAVTWWLAWCVTGRAGAAWFAWGTLMAAPGLLLTNAVFPDGVAPLLVSLGLLPLVDRRARSPLVLAGLGASVMLLPWLHTRLAVVAATLGIVVIVRLVREPYPRSRVMAFLAAPVAGAVAWFAYFWVIYGTLNPSAPIGKPLLPSLVGPSLFGMLMDQRFGLLALAPVYLCAIAGGIAALRSSQRRLGIEGLAIVVPYTLMIAAWDMWWGGTSPPARFLVPLCPLLAVAAGMWVSQPHRHGGHAVAGALMACSLLVAFTMVWIDRGALIFAERNQPSPVLAWLSPVVDLSSAAPDAFAHPLSAGLLLAGLWLAIVALAAVAARACGTDTRHVWVGLAGEWGITVAVGLAWAWHGGSSVRPFDGGAQVVAHVASAPRAIGVHYRPFRSARASEVARLVSLATFEPAPNRDVALRAAELPAGTYEVAGSVEGTDSPGTIRVRTDRRSPLVALEPIVGRRWSREITVPVGIRGLEIDASDEVAAHITRMRLRFLAPLARERQPFPGMVAGHGARYGGQVFYNMTGLSWLEPSGIWVGGGDGAEFAVVTDRSGPLPLLVRNGAVANRVVIGAGVWSVSLELAAGEVRTIAVPVDPRQVATALRVVPSSGFRPKDVDPAATDDRYLGVWIESAG